MKITHTLFLFISLFCSTLLPKLNLIAENTEFIFDIDEVLLREMAHSIISIKLIFGGIIQNPFNAKSYLYAFLSLENLYSKDKNGNKCVCDKNNNIINGLTFQFLHHGMRDPRLTSYITWMIKTMEYSRTLIYGSIKICKYLKETKGYTINFATNKDRLLYNLTAKNFSDIFTNIPQKVFVAHPGNDNAVLTQLKEFATLPTTPTSYKTLERNTRIIKPTNVILHASSRKPESEYYQFIEENLNAKNKNIIFIDDNKYNIEGFITALPSSSTAQRIGIHFKNPIQLAKELIKLGILSEIDDKKFLDELCYPRIFDTITSSLQHIFAHL